VTTPLGAPDLQRRATAVLAIALVFGALLVFLPCLVSLLLASWVTLLTRSLMKTLTRWLRGRAKASAAITTLVVIALLGPLLLAIVPIVVSAGGLAREVLQSQQWHDAAQAVTGEGGATDADLMKLIRSQASNAWAAAALVFRTSVTLLFGTAIFLVALFGFSAHGDRLVSWLRAHSPLSSTHFDRLARVYADAGRGLVIGVGVTALIQGALATITYLIAGIPRALALGLLTTVSALIPGVGTLIVWGPVTVILAMGGFPGRAIFVALSGVLLISSVDNFLKPFLSNRANLRLPSILIFVTMLSGLAAFGPAGLVLGPLFVSLAIEILAIAREERLVGADDIGDPEGGNPRLPVLQVDADHETSR
jgi:predicted PurR-regulated permease PerM